MRKKILLLIAFLSSINIVCTASNALGKGKNAKRAAVSTKGGKRAATMRRGGAKRALVPVSAAKSKTVEEEVKENENINQEGLSDFAICMDKLCKSTSSDDEKGRCRCSSQLGRIEKILRDIEKIRDEADAKNKNLETLMNVSNTSVVSDSLGQVYTNINSIEKKSRNLSSQKVDATTRLIEGLPLYNEALKQCDKTLTASPSNDREGLKTDYMNLIEKDCAAYTSVLKDKADAASQLLVQAQKNQEMYDEQEYKKLNQLDTNSCFVEYETCMKTQCGENYTNCLETAKLEANLKKCQSINYGKCEDNKSVVMLNLRKAIDKAFAKEKVAQACRSAMGSIVQGQCLFKVQYRADGTFGSGEQDEKYFKPGYTVRCGDNGGDFRDVKAGCSENCYLVAQDDKSQKRIGENKGCKNVAAKVLTFGIAKTSLDTYKLPVPEGWGTDGYPKDEELKKAF